MPARPAADDDKLDWRLGDKPSAPCLGCKQRRAFAWPSDSNRLAHCDVKWATWGEVQSSVNSMVGGTREEDGWKCRFPSCVTCAYWSIDDRATFIGYCSWAGSGRTLALANCSSKLYFDAATGIWELGVMAPASQSQKDRIVIGRLVQVWQKFEVTISKLRCLRFDC